LAKRTHWQDYEYVEEGDDLERVVRDKREAWRANKRKKHRRHRHYVNTMLRHLSRDADMWHEEE